MNHSKVRQKQEPKPKDSLAGGKQQSHVNTKDQFPGNK